MEKLANTLVAVHRHAGSLQTYHGSHLWVTEASQVCSSACPGATDAKLSRAAGCDATLAGKSLSGHRDLHPS
ncbi:hypothetical protein DDE18_20955 [Nocardioides gansuensis]|uniref:Uncharacterized protein n=1 Tax=Nocardioides gansuensis TaxID=2138300 RepID=A0A2T8F550_9ACTN|nr:hypothetical protein [Nocardioides gansuensis]PVG80855.1 hypothetical protein DDE18_20955 [Nocardioides gansuensis]